MTTPTPPSAAGGQLLGTNMLQGTIDRFAAAVNQLDGVIKSLGNTPTGFGRQASGGNGNTAQQAQAYGTFPSMSNPFAAGAPAGGTIKPILRYNNTTGTTQPTGAYQFSYAGGGANAGGAKNTPGGPMGGGNSGRMGPGAFGIPGTMAAAGKQFFGGVQSMGSGALPTQLALSAYVQQGMLNAPMGMSGNAAQGYLRSAAFGNGYTTMNAIANNAMDAAQGQALINSASGAFAGRNALGHVMTGGANVFGYTNPSLGYAGSAALSQQMYSPQMSMQMLMSGYGRTPLKMGGGNPMSSPGSMQALMSGIFGGKRSVSQQNFAGSMAAGRGIGWYDLQALGLSGQNLSSAVNTLGSYNRLSNAGYSNSAISGLFNGARNDNQTDINKLSRAGITQSDIQILKNNNAAKTGTQSNTMQGFQSGLGTSVGLLTKFNEGLSALLRGPLGEIAGWGGGMGAGKGLASTSGLGGLLSGATGMAGGAMGFVKSAVGLFGGAASPGAGRTSQSSPAKSTKSSSAGSISGSAKAAVSAAENEIGVPYVWGGEQPRTGNNAGGFDCSGLTQWAYKQAGVNLPRTSQLQWDALQNRSVPLNQVQEGDLIFSAGSGDGGTFSSPGHVAMMVSNNRLIQAPFTGADVEVIPYNPSAWQHAARPKGSLSGGSSANGSGSASSPGSGATMGGGGNFLSSTSESANLMAALGGSSGGGGGGGMGGLNGGTTSSANGTSTGSSGLTGSGTAGGSNEALAKQMAAKRGWTGSQWNAVKYVESREDASWSLTAKNPGSDAYGIAQFINGPSEYYQYGGNPNTASGQITGFFNYMQQRYHGPQGAAAHEKAFNWYGAGTSSARKGPMIVGDRGPEVMEAKGGERITPLGRASAALLSSTGAGGGGCTLNLTFSSGSIQVSGGASGSDVSSSGREIAREIGKHLESERVIQKIAAGVS